eukprot:8678614-Karenia_brevis.AAC.1
MELSMRQTLNIGGLSWSIFGFDSRTKPGVVNVDREDKVEDLGAGVFREGRSKGVQSFSSQAKLYEPRLARLAICYKAV